MIDTQIHLLDPWRQPYPAMTRGYRPAPDEDGTLEDLSATLGAHGIARAVLVQASVYGTDNHAILAAAAAEPQRFRAVVVTDAPALDRIARTPGVAGVRLNLTDYGGHGEREDVQALADAVLRHGLILQLQATPSDAAALVGGLPPGPVVLDHFGRPDLSRAGDLETIARLAARPECHLKVSAAFRLSGLDDWQGRDSRLAALCDAFGSNRVLWGSDWPFINLGGPRPSYAETLAAAASLIDLDRASANAARLFGWPDD